MRLISNFSFAVPSLSDIVIRCYTYAAHTCRLVPLFTIVYGFGRGGGGASTYPDPVVQISRILSLSISDLLKRFYSLIMAGRRCVLSSFRFFHVDCFPFFLSTSKRHTYLKPSSNSEYPACTPAVIIFALHRTVSVCILWREIEIT